MIHAPAHVMLRRSLLLLVAGAWVTGVCGRSSGSEGSPELVVRQFIDLLRGFHGDEAQSEALYRLFSKRAQRNLRERAERYGAASGKPMGPWAMLVPSRMGARFVPELYVAQLAGKYAMVEVAGTRPGDRAQIPCVFEDDHWRVDLVLPELPPLRRRPSVTGDK